LEIVPQSLSSLSDSRVVVSSKEGSDRGSGKKEEGNIAKQAPEAPVDSKFKISKEGSSVGYHARKRPRLTRSTCWKKEAGGRKQGIQLEGGPANRLNRDGERLLCLQAKRKISLSAEGRSRPSTDRQHVREEGAGIISKGGPNPINTTVPTLTGRRKKEEKRQWVEGLASTRED